MTSFPNRLTYLIFILALLLLSTLPALSQQTNIRISTPEAFKAEFDAVPCKNEDRQEAAKALFVKMGAKPSDISVEKFKNAENLVLTIKGASAEKIIIGAHYDKVSPGCGAIDNWTGVVALAHLYRTLRDMPLQKTLIFVAFGNEEKGLFGSHAMAESISKDTVSEYCGMVNIDSLGLGNPQVADNMSSKKLGVLAADLAAKMKIKFAHATIGNASADSVSFVEKKIPAITIHGLTSDWATILHTSYDKPSKVDATNVYLGYRLALAVVGSIGSASCVAYR